MLVLLRAWRLGARCMAWLEAARRAREQLKQDEMRGKARAENKARALLLNLMNREQRHEFQACGHFHVRGGSTGERYRIREDPFVNIDVLSDDGTVKFHLCARPTGHLPIFDVMAGQMLYLQNADTEERFLAQANKHTTFVSREFGQ